MKTEHIFISVERCGRCGLHDVRYIIQRGDADEFRIRCWTCAQLEDLPPDLREYMRTGRARGRS